jgi:phospholipid/cholesterol/gamma-HCH transport system substrate-binding protein
MKRLREANRALVGAVCLVLCAAVMLGAFYFENLPLIGGQTYSAEFSEAAGLKSGAEVRIAGVKAGQVTGMALEGRHIRVDFRVDGAWLGDRTRASIEIKTLLGQKYLALAPQGDRPLDPDNPIPLDRTQAPYDVMEAFNDAGRAEGEINTQELAQSFQVMADTFRDSPQDVGNALRGLSAMSQTIASRDEGIRHLLQDTDQVSQILGDHSAEFQRLLADGNQLLDEIRFREDAITRLLQGTEQLATQLRGLVADNGGQLQPALAKLDQITAVLHANQDSLSRGLANLAPFSRLFTNTVGNGRWFDSYICGQFPPVLQAGPAGVNQQGCQPPIAGGGQK